MPPPRRFLSIHVPARDRLSREVLLSNVRRSLFGRASASTAIGPYQVKRRLGGGTMGSIFESYDPRLDRPIALKLVNTAALPGANASHLRREAQALARLDHANVVTVYDAGECELGVWIAMELLVGQDLAAWLRRSPRASLASTLAMLRRVGRGVVAVHGAGIVHRDIKPANVFLADSGEVKLVDFGLALIDADTLPSQRSPAAPSPIAPRATVSGTPAYMAPEQHRGEPATAKSDQYAWCVMAWEALYDGRPFSAQDFDASHKRAIENRLSATPPRADVPSRMHAALLRGLSPQPRDRWPVMEDLLAQFAAPPGLAWRAYAGVGAGSAIVLGWAIASAPAPTPCPTAGVWDSSERDSIRAALVGGGSEFRRDTWARVEPRLEAHAAAYEETRSKTCGLLADQRIDQRVADQRFGCLRRWKASFEKVTEALHGSGKRAVAAAIGRTLDIENPLRCADVGPRVPTKQPPPPAALRDGVAEVRGQLFAARTKVKRAEFADALALLDDLQRDPVAPKFPPLAAELLYLTATTYNGLGRWKDAESSFVAAYHEAQRAQHGYIEAAAAIDMVLLALKLGDPDKAESWIRRGRAAQHEPWPEFAVGLSTVEAIVLEQQGKPEGSLNAALRSVALAEALGPSPAKFAAVGSTVARLIEAGRVQEAHALAKRSLDEQRATFGPKHPWLAPALGMFALAAWSTGDVDASFSAFERVIALRRRHFGEEAQLGEHARWLAADLINFANRLSALERWQEAAVKLDEAVPILEEMLPASHSALVHAALTQGSTALGLGDHEAAQRHFERAQVLAEEASGVASDDVGLALVGKGATLLRRGTERGKEARAALERGWKLLQGGTRANREGPTGEIARVPYLLAEAIWVSGGSRAEAIDMALVAEELARGSHPVAVRTAAKVKTWLREHPAPTPP